jgi:5-methylcytosine-specific restriction enzyme A
MSQGWSGGSDSRWRAFRRWVLRLDLSERSRPLCAIGGPKCVQVATHVDHIVPLALGGAKYDPLNARPACEPCNTGRRVEVAQYEPAPSPVSRW